jgi:hypothetical protein
MSIGRKCSIMPSPDTPRVRWQKPVVWTFLTLITLYALAQLIIGRFFYIDR